MKQLQFMILSIDMAACLGTLCMLVVPWDDYPVSGIGHTKKLSAPASAITVSGSTGCSSDNCRRERELTPLFPAAWHRPGILSATIHINLLNRTR